MTLVERRRQQATWDYYDSVRTAFNDAIDRIKALEQERDRLRERNAVLGGLLRAALWDYETHQGFKPDGSSHWSAQARAALAATGDKA